MNICYNVYKDEIKSNRIESKRIQTRWKWCCSQFFSHYQVIKVSNVMGISITKGNETKWTNKLPFVCFQRKNGTFRKIVGEKAAAAKSIHSQPKMAQSMITIIFFFLFVFFFLFSGNICLVYVFLVPKINCTIKRGQHLLRKSIHGEWSFQVTCRRCLRHVVGCKFSLLIHIWYFRAGSQVVCARH